MRTHLLCTSVFVLLAIALFCPLTAFSEEIIVKEFVELKTRNKVKQRFVLLAPEKPVANIVIICGGRGKINVSKFFGKPYI